MRITLKNLMRLEGSYEGRWWIPENPDLVVDGTLIIDKEENKCELKIRYSSTNEREYISFTLPNIEIMCGYVKGEKITFYNCLKRNGFSLILILIYATHLGLKKTL